MEYKIDEYGRAVIGNKGVFDLFSSGETLNGFVIEIDDEIKRYNENCRKNGKDDYIIHENNSSPISIKDRLSDWHIPSNYAQIDIVDFCLSRCSNDIERERVEEELPMFAERGLIPLLLTLIFMVDKFREDKVLWGVGRGSSVASFVLYLIGIHRIDPIKYQLDISEFLRD